MKSLFKNPIGRVRAGWKIAGCWGLTMLLAVALISLRRQLPDGLQHAIPEPLLMAIASVLAAAACLRLERATLASIGLRLDARFLRLWAVGSLVGASLLAMTAFLVWLGGGFDLALVQTADGGAAALWKITRTLLPLAVFEELTFRGYPFQRALAALGARRALVLFGALFAIVHLPNPGLDRQTFVLALANLFMASMMLGLCWLRSGSLALPIGVHLGWNWAQTVLGFPSSGNPSHGVWTPVLHGNAAWLTGGAFGLEASLAGVGVLGLAIVVLARWQRVAAVRSRAAAAAIA